MVHGDEKALLQMVTNLIDNALKYTSEGGQVKIELGTDDSWAYFSVTDTGIASRNRSSKECLNDSTESTKRDPQSWGGTGLGLSIVRHIALAHGGDVSVESTLGTGSVFKVKLPSSGIAGTVQ